MLTSFEIKEKLDCGKEFISASIAEHKLLCSYLKDVGGKGLFQQSFKEILSAKKIQTLLANYKNPCVAVYKEILTICKKIFKADGLSFNPIFAEGKESQAQELRLSNARKYFFSSVSDSQWFEMNILDKIFTTPNDVLLTLAGDDEDKEIETKVIPIAKVIAIEIDVYEGFEICFLCYQLGENNKQFFAIDEEYTYVFEKDNNDIYFLTTPTKHNIGFCPATLCSNMPYQYVDNDSSNAYLAQTAVIAGSPFSFHKSKLNDLLLIGNLNHYNHITSAYPTLTNIDVNSGNDQVNNLSLEQRQKINEQSYLGTPQELINSKQTKYGNVPNDINGGVILLVNDEVATRDGGQYIKNIVDSIQAKYPEMDWVKFNLELPDIISDRIIETICGAGSYVLKYEAINKEQVEANLQDQQTKLSEIATIIECVWSNVLTAAGCVISMNFEKYYVQLGREFYLKSTEQLFLEYQNLETIDANYFLKNYVSQKIAKAILRDNALFEISKKTDALRVLLGTDYESKIKYYQSVSQDYSLNDSIYNLSLKIEKLWQSKT